MSFKLKIINAKNSVNKQINKLKTKIKATKAKIFRTKTRINKIKVNSTLGYSSVILV